MSVLDNITPTVEQQDYQFEDGDLSFISELDKPKEAMAFDERPDFGETVGNDDPLNAIGPDEGEHNDDLIAAAVEETATLITDTIDNGAAFGLSLISKNPIETHKATDDQKGRMRKIIYVYCEKTGGYIPLWLQLVILIIGIYGVQIPAAIQARKINVLEAKVKEQEEKLKAYELEKQSRVLATELKEKRQADAGE